MRQSWSIGCVRLRGLVAVLALGAGLVILSGAPPSVFAEAAAQQAEPAAPAVLPIPVPEIAQREEDVAALRRQSAERLAGDPRVQDTERRLPDASAWIRARLAGTTQALDASTSTSALNNLTDSWTLMRSTLAAGRRGGLRADDLGGAGSRAGCPTCCPACSTTRLLLVGFLFAVSALSFALTRITILAGAFGVGIGIGLQERGGQLRRRADPPARAPDPRRRLDRDRRLAGRGPRDRVPREHDPHVRRCRGDRPERQADVRGDHQLDAVDRKRRVDLTVTVAYATDPAQVLDVLRKDRRGVSQGARRAGAAGSVPRVPRRRVDLRAARGHASRRRVRTQRPGHGRASRPRRG